MAFVWLCLSIVSLTAYLAASHRLRGVLARQSAVEQATIVAAGLTPGPAGDLSKSVANLQSRSRRLLAVATLDVVGGIHTVFPGGPAHRNAVNLARAALGEYDAYGTRGPAAAQVRVRAPETGEMASAFGVIVPLKNDEVPSAQRVVVLLRSEAATGAWLEASTLFVVSLAIGGLVCYFSITSWFNRRVAVPLRRMVGMAHGSGPGRDRRRRSDRPRARRETSEIAALLDNLVDGLEQGDVERRRMEAAVERERRERESTFQRQLRRAEDRACTDPLTKLRNRAFLEESLERIAAHHREEDKDLAVVVIDVDNFKQHNDKLGHQAGDELLVFVGALLKGGVRPTDYAIRVGGDEFLLLLPGVGASDATAIAERIVKLFGQYVRRLGTDTPLSLSAGVATLKSDPCRSGHDLIAQADAALYAAKRVGKNTVVASNVRGSYAAV